MKGNNQDNYRSETISLWVNKFSDELFSWAYYKTSDRAASEDLVQETFMAAYQSFKNFTGKSSPKTWILSILNNKINDYYRKKFRSIDLTENNLMSDSTEKLYDYFFNDDESWKNDRKPVEWNYSDESLLDDSNFNDILKICLDKLPSNSFSVIRMKYLNDKEGKEICKDLGISASNYWQILHRAKLQLRECIENNWFKK